MIYLDLFVNKPLYCIIIIVALIAGLGYYLVSIKNAERFKLKAVIFLLSGTFSIVLSLSICALVSMIFSDKKAGYRSVFSIFYAFITFPFFTGLLQKSAKMKLDFKEYVNPVLLSITIARIACMVEGCCNGSIYAAYVEAGITLSLFIYNQIKKDLNFPTLYAIYPTWRFIAEFFKETYDIEKLGILTLMQYAAGIAVVLSIIVITLPKRRTEYEKQ